MAKIIPYDGLTMEGPKVPSEARSAGAPRLAKMVENVQFQRCFFEKFSGGIAPRPPYWGGATVPLQMYVRSVQRL